MDERSNRQTDHKTKENSKVIKHSRLLGCYYCCYY